MLKYLALFLIVIGSAANAHSYRCEFLEQGGLHFDDGRWNPVAYEIGDPFFLETGTQTIKWAAINKLFEHILDSHLEGTLAATCQHLNSGLDHCFSTLGLSLVFDSETKNGGMSFISGTTSASEVRDDVWVSAFACNDV